MTMQHCVTCKYWSEKVVDITLDNKRRCCCPKIICRHRQIGAPHDGAYIDDSKGWGILTGPDFGCVNHKVQK